MTRPAFTLLAHKAVEKTLRLSRVWLMQLQTALVYRTLHRRGVCTANKIMTRIAFFGHDAADAAVRRRVQGFRDDGLEVIGFMKRRRDEVQTDWENVDLGKTFDGD